MTDAARNSLGDYVHVKHGFAFKGEHFTDDPTPDVLVTPGNFAIGGGFQGEKLKYYAGPVPDEYVLEQGDLVITMTDLSKAGDTLGYPALIPASKGKRYLHNQRVGRVEIHDEEQVDKRFLYYRLCASDYRHHILATASGSTVRHTSPGRIGQFETTPPPIDEQRAIAGVLGALDAKIEQNRQTAQVLERLARAIFRAWFVDFEPVKAKAAGATAFPSMPQLVFDALPTRFVDSDIGAAPEGWSESLHKVSDLEDRGWLQVGDGYRAKRSELAAIGLPFIRAGNVNGTVETVGAELIGDDSVARVGTKRSQAWDTVFTSKGSVGRLGLVTPSTGSVVYSPQVCFWRSLDAQAVNPFFLHLWLRSYSFTKQWMAVKGETDMADFVSLSDQRAMRMQLPAPQLQAAFASIVEPLFRVRSCLDSESRSLAEMRDYLLPKLLSGEVQIQSIALEEAKGQ